MKHPDIRIAVVDDEQTILFTVQTMLSEYNITCFDNSQVAIEHSIINKYDVIITDFCMPGMNGLELLKRIREKYTNFKSILITAYANIDLLEDYINGLQINRYLEKPFSFKVLRKILDQCIEEIAADRRKRRIICSRQVEYAAHKVNTDKI